MIVCDTHALVFDALSPDLLGSESARAIEESHRTGEMACADISLWEIAKLIKKGRFEVYTRANSLAEMKSPLDPLGGNGG